MCCASRRRPAACSASDSSSRGWRGRARRRGCGVRTWREGLCSSLRELRGAALFGVVCLYSTFQVSKYVRLSNNHSLSPSSPAESKPIRSLSQPSPPPTPARCGHGCVDNLGGAIQTIRCRHLQLHRPRAISLRLHGHRDIFCDRCPLEETVGRSLHRWPVLVIQNIRGTVVFKPRSATY